MAYYDFYGNLLAKAYDFKGNVISSGDDYRANSGLVSGTVYKFSDMAMTDVDGVATETTEHLQNASTGIMLTTPDTSTEHEVIFDGLNIPTNGEAFNLWFYISRKDKGVTGGYGQYSTFTRVYVSLNGGTYKCLSFSSGANAIMLVSGINCYHWLKANSPTTITSIAVKIKSNVAGGSVILDSVEIGRKYKIPHILFNFDSSGKNFYNLGYELFKSYGFPATFDYHASATDGANSGTWDDATDAQKHFAMLADGFDYGVYSKYVASTYGTTGTAPAYDDTSSDAMVCWREQAKLMWDSNNDLGIKCPSTVHSTGHKSGEAYARAMAEKPFLLIRADSAYKTANQFIHSVSADYKEVVPYYCVDTWESTDDGVTWTKTLIDKLISEGTSAMWMSHTIQSNDDEHDALNIGYNAMKEILDYLKPLSDAGKIIVDSTATFIQEVYPDRYAEWVTGRD